MPQAIDEAGNVFETDAQGNPVRLITAAPSKGRLFTLPRSEKEIRQEERQARAEARAEASAARSAGAQERQAGAAERTAGNQHYDNVLKLRSDFDALPAVKEYRTAIAQLATGIKTAPNATGDNALIYAYAKAMDPGSVVRESEMGMAASGASAIDATVASLKKQLGIEGGGQLAPNVRERMRVEMANKVAQLNQVYKVQRSRFANDAKAFGLDPDRIIGPHDGDAFMDDILEYNAARQRADNEVPDPTTGADLKPPPSPSPPDAPPPENGLDDRLSSVVDQMINDKTPIADINVALAREGTRPLDAASYEAARKWMAENPGQPYYGARIAKPEGFNASILGEGLSGANEGLANVLGAPADLSAAAINAGIGGVNALTDADIPTINNPLLGSQQIKAIMERAGSIAPAGDHPFARRVGQSVGAAAVPLAGPGLNIARYGGQLAAGLGGGVGAAAAQQAFPGNPLAEMGGEILGGGLTAGGILKGAQRNARRGIEANVPTIPQLKEQAGDLYRAAESRGVVASPEQTQLLSDNFRAALAAEGRVSPTGRISEVYPKAREAVQLIDDYAGQTMNPTQIQNVRGVVADALASPERAERRLGGILTDVLDEWANPLAPELSEARNVASRYLTAEQLTQARELAGARAGQFTGSGFENALRTEYRGLDRGAIKGNKRFGDDVTEAIETVSRGTPTSNFFRGLGRLAPTGPVSGMGSVVPALTVGSLATPGLGAAVGGTLAGAGIAGRGIATHMGIKAADQAELIARNGGQLPAPVIDPEWLRTLRLYGLAELGNNLPEPVTYPTRP